MDIQKQIANLKKQNDGMESSFAAKDIKFTKLTIENVEPDLELMLLKDHNEYLKNISKQNRPPPAVKEEKSKEQPKPKDVDDEDDLPKEVKPVYTTITNMEDIKRAFFSKEYETAHKLIQEHPFRFYKANYKYSSDNTGRPGYVAKNLLRGFVQGLDDFRKYFMICFRCILIDRETNEYRYPSYWIVNTNDDLKTVLGSIYDDYDFIALEGDEAIGKMLKKMEKNEDANDEALIGEVYLH
jgi:hypothetical protein